MFKYFVKGEIEGDFDNPLTVVSLARLFGEYESYSTHPGVGVRVTHWLRFCIKVHILHHSLVTTRCITLKLSTRLPNYQIHINKEVR